MDRRIREPDLGGTHQLADARGSVLGSAAVRVGDKNVEDALRGAG